jgi:nucleotide-binding universal stress UspA family protein
MKPIKKILVPVDFSAHSAEALRLAADLARRYAASVDLVHVFFTMTYGTPEGYVIPTAEQLELVMKELESQLRAAKQIALDAGAPSATTTLLQGRPATAILDFATASECDLIVMGTHGRTGVKRLVIGSVAEHVVRAAPCPVLTVRASA